MDLYTQIESTPLANILTSFAEERPTTPARTPDPMPEKLRQLGSSGRQRAIVARVWRMRAEAFALADAGRLPIFDAKTGEMRAMPKRSAFYGHVRLLHDWATEAFHGECPLLVLVLDPLNDDEPMIVELPWA